MTSQLSSQHRPHTRPPGRRGSDRPGLRPRQYQRGRQIRTCAGDAVGIVGDAVIVVGRTKWGHIFDHIDCCARPLLTSAGLGPPGCKDFTSQFGTGIGSTGIESSWHRRQGHTAALGGFIQCCVGHIVAVCRDQGRDRSYRSEVQAFGQLRIEHSG